AYAEGTVVVRIAAGARPADLALDRLHVLVHPVAADREHGLEQAREVGFERAEAAPGEVAASVVRAVQADGAHPGADRLPVDGVTRVTGVGHLRLPELAARLSPPKSLPPGVLRRRAVRLADEHGARSVANDALGVAPQELVPQAVPATGGHDDEVGALL